ncbi:mercuric reductase [Geminocystis sp. NIES-3708]|uniref:FAD-dependent oxidoreductase n=1 Tax=Geminocystis sp. NIES-3708 TaxID=1615909 RepID=UPI0005FC8E4D|nr:FAD-dependent oxidoreductase [Geminocystis sp. NIES-3708]BAQ60847.1 mercuric reductase [Geminocystis sp. NIES-3708]
MKFHYDLVVIGGTKQGILAAEYAAKLGARVALVIDSDYLEENDNQSFVLEFKDDLLRLNNNISCQEFIAEKKLILMQKSLLNLELLEVDIIKSNCYFHNHKNLTLLTSKYQLKSSSYLLASIPHQLFLENILETDNHIQINHLLSQDNWNNLPQNIVIFGDDISAIYLANKLITLGKNITLVNQNQQILPTEDEDISFQLQLILESQGIKIYTQSHINNFHHNGDTDNQIIIVTNHIFLKENKLRLDNLGIKSEKGKILVNNKLQTQHHQVYACGDLLGGYNLDNVTEYEIKIAVNNSLFFPWQKINYYHIPYILSTNPPLYRVGYTEKQARLLSNKNIKTLIINSNLFSGLSLGENNIFIKIILDDNNNLLGFHGLGFELEEILTGITLLIKQKKVLSDLFKLKFSQLKSLEIVRNIQQVWLAKNNTQHQFIMNLLETFFIWKRM